MADTMRADVIVDLLKVMSIIAATGDAVIARVAECVCDGPIVLLVGEVEGTCLSCGDKELYTQGDEKGWYTADQVRGWMPETLKLAPSQWPKTGQFNRVFVKAMLNNG